MSTKTTEIQISKSIVWVVYDPIEPAIDDDDTVPHTVNPNPIISKSENQVVLKSSRFRPSPAKPRVEIDWQAVMIVGGAVLTAVVQVLGVVLGALASGIAEAASHSCLFSKWE